MKTREEYARLFDRLREMGMRDVERFYHWTPRAIAGEIRAHARREQILEERMLRAAWRVGRYGGIGVHAPGRYPPMPQAQFRPRGGMRAGEMKRVLMTMAGRKEK